MILDTSLGNHYLMNGKMFTMAEKMWFSGKEEVQRNIVFRKDDNGFGVSEHMPAHSPC